MATEVFQFSGVAGTTHYLAIFNSTGQVLDFNDSTFKALSGATTPYVTATERADMGGAKSGFTASVNLANVNSTATPTKYFADWYTATNLGTCVSNTIEFCVASSEITIAGYTAPDNATITAINGKTTNLPSDPADASDVAASFSTVNSTLSTIAAYIDTEIAAIKLQTDLIPASPAAVGSAMTLATGAITTGSFAAGAIDATAIAADALGASELAAGAATEVVTAINAAGVKVRQITPEAADLIVDRLGMAQASIYDGTDNLYSRLKPLHSGYAQGGDEIAWVGGYSAITTGSGNFSGGSGRRRRAIQLGHYTRFMQAGTITELDIYIAASIPAEMKVSVWRYNGVGYDLVGESENFAQRLTASTTNRVVLERPIKGVQEGDYYGFELYSTSSCLKVMTGQTGGAYIYYYDSEITDSVGVAWTSGTGQSGWILPVLFYMEFLGFVCVGGSIAVGHPAHYSYQETTATSSPSSSPPYLLAQLNGLTYQNRGIGSQTSTNVEARFQAQAVDLSPGFILLVVGVNDIAAIADPTNAGQVAAAKVTYLAKIDSMLSMAAAASIPVVLMKILPWTDGTNDQHVVRNDWNSALASRASSVVLVVDLDDELGQFKSGGVALNHDDILTAYDSDGVHFNVSGYTAMAAGVNTAIEASPTFEALCLGTAGSSTLLLADDAISGTTPYDENQLQIISGTGAGQARRIISQSARTVTLDRAWDTAPDRTSRYKIVGQAADNTTIGTRAATGDAMTLTSGERTSIANEIEAQIIDDTDSEKVLTAITDKIASVNPSLNDLTLAAIATANRAEMDSNSTKLSAILEDTGTTIPATLAGLSTFAAGGEVTLADGAITAAKIGANAITDAKVASDVTIASVTGAVGSVTAGVTLDASLDLYHSDIHLDVDEATETDEYTVTWFKNGVRVTSGITVPTLQVIKRADGSDLLAATAMTQVGSTGSYKKDCTTTNRVTAGEAVIAVAVATIDGASRSFSRVIGRDSEAG